MSWLLIVVFGVALGGVAAAWLRPGCGGPDLSSAELLERMNQPGLLLLDVRSAKEYDSGHIGGAVNIAHSGLSAQLDRLRSHMDQTIVVYCESGLRARMACRTLTQAGFPHVYHLAGDMAGWRRAEHPVQRKTAREP